MVRVWLSEWEWACCGEAFAVGDDVDFGIESRAPSAVLAEMLGVAVGRTYRSRSASNGRSSGASTP